MDVTRFNFERALRVFKKHVQTASFAAIDLEFLGFGTSWPSQLDTPARRYEMARDAAVEYPPCQFGIALFRPAANDNHPVSDETPQRAWEVVPFNFTLCLAPVYKTGFAKFPMRDAVFSVQAWCAHFLYQNYFDFNKMFETGIMWLRKDDEEDIREEMMEWIRPQREEGDLAFSDLIERDQLYVTSLSGDIVAHFGKEIRSGNSLASGAKPDSEEITPANSGAAQKPVSGILLCDAHDNPVVRKYVHDYLSETYPSLFVSVLPSPTIPGRSMLRLERMGSTEEARKATEAARLESLERSVAQRLSRAVGFRHVIDALLEAGVPIVAHNALHDMCKMLANFVRPLPPDLVRFKQELHASIPALLDTKHFLTNVAKQVPWVQQILTRKSYEGHSALTGLHRILDSKCMEKDVGLLNVRFYEGSEMDDDEYDLWGYDEFGSLQSHEAGYDSFVCGKVFLQLASILAGKLFDPPTEAGVHAFLAKVKKHEAVARLANQLSIPSCGGYSSIDISSQKEGEDEKNKFRTRNDVLVVLGLRQYANSQGIRYGAKFSETLSWTKELFEKSAIQINEAEFRIIDDDKVLVVVESRTTASKASTDPAVSPVVGAHAGADEVSSESKSKKQRTAREMLSSGGEVKEADLAPARAEAAKRGLEVISYSEALELPPRKQRRRGLLVRGWNA